MNENFKAPPIIFWAIWGFMFTSIFIYQAFLGGGIPSGKDDGKPEQVFLIICICLIIVSSFIRWVLIPKQKDLAKLLPLMIIGLALGETVQFIQIFIIQKKFPETQLQFFLLGIICVAQYIPFYAKNPVESINTMHNK